MKDKNLPTQPYKVILASSSKTRRGYIKKFIKDVQMIDHLIKEESIKAKIKDPCKLALTLAQRKAASVVHMFPKDMVIGSDQVLVCDQVIMSKPKNHTDAIKNLLFLRNKKHTLISSIFVFKSSKVFFKQIKKAQIFFKEVSKEEIENYVYKNENTVFSTVGSYKIEENNKHKFLDVVTGDADVIIGFPMKDFMRRLYEDK